MICVSASGEVKRQHKSHKRQNTAKNDDEEIENLRVACKLGREVLDEAFNAVAIGVTTDEIDRIGMYAL